VTLYSVFERSMPRPGADPAPAIVGDKFSWPAALLPPVFLLWHGLWLALLGFAAALALIVVASILWIGGGAGFWLYVLLAIFFGFEAPGMRRAGLARKGFAYRGEHIAPAADLAQLGWLQRRGERS
jgi:hypothetical protein